MLSNSVGKNRDGRHVNIRWIQPKDIEVQLDVDGSYKNGISGYGDIIRDNNADWVASYNSSVGNFPSTITKIISLIRSLEVCRLLAFVRVKAYMYYAEEIHLIFRQDLDQHP